jgi:hypothetical protein
VLTMPVFFNNCRRRPHTEIYRGDAFYDLNPFGMQADMVVDLERGQECVVATPNEDGDIDFVWFSFSREVRMPDEKGNPSRVFVGKRLRAKTLPKAKAARTKPYAVYFNRKGHFKRRSVIEC